MLGAPNSSDHGGRPIQVTVLRGRLVRIQWCDPQ